MGVVTMSTNKYQKCIDLCTKCAQACFECFKACLNEPDVSARKNCIATLVECALMCQQAATQMSIESQSAVELCLLCANICDRCAQECAMFKDDHCQKCAEVCRACANECRMMAGMR